ncbi:hypothetical protein AeMF1_017583 [Aphanomyces euteiches]|nr:hypothetical protein AeMF1_017583 [Aphanomyces euteiches]KAH9182445.1 hypothetical protein AeNC1_015578 [Aphanomyces euteiches]
MLDRWGDFDTDALLHAELAEEDQAFLEDAVILTHQPRRHTGDGKSKTTASSRLTASSGRASTASQSTAAASSGVLFPHVHDKHTSAMFTWMLESESMRQDIHKALQPIWSAVQDAAGGVHSKIQPETMDLVAQRLAKRYPRVVLPSHGVSTAMSLDLTSFGSVLCQILVPVMTYTTVQDCFQGLYELVAALVRPISSSSSFTFQALGDIVSVRPFHPVPALATKTAKGTGGGQRIGMEIRANPTLLLQDQDISSRQQVRTPSSSLSSRDMASDAKIAHQHQIEQRLRLRKSFHSHDLPLSTTNCSNEQSQQDQQNQHLNTNQAGAGASDEGPATEISLNLAKQSSLNQQKPRKTKGQRRSLPLKDPHGPTKNPQDNQEVIGQNLKEDNDDKNGDELVLVCCVCAINQAVLWCSPCFTMTCIACWSHRHMSPVPAILPTPSSSSSFSSCLQTQSKVQSDSFGPPLPLVQPQHESRSNQSTTQKKLHQLRFRGKSHWNPSASSSSLASSQHTLSLEEIATTYHLAKATIPGGGMASSSSMPSLYPKRQNLPKVAPGQEKNRYNTKPKPKKQLSPQNPRRLGLPCHAISIQLEGEAATS